MTRRCDLCAWWDRKRPHDTEFDRKLCREGPAEHFKAPWEWCSRFRAIEAGKGGGVGDGP